MVYSQYISLHESIRNNIECEIHGIFSFTIYDQEVFSIATSYSLIQAKI